MTGSSTISRWRSLVPVLVWVALLCLPSWGWAADLPAVRVTNTGGGQQYSLTLQLLALMTTLTLLPSLLLMMTSFVRIVIVLSILRQALGTGQTPPNMVLVGLALFLSLFVMSPVLSEVYQSALVPFMNNPMGFEQALAAAANPGERYRHVHGDRPQCAGGQRRPSAIHYPGAGFFDV